MAKTPKSGIRFETYADVSGAWRWRMVDGNNRIVGNSGESFTRERDVTRACKNIMADLADPAQSMGLTKATRR
jgi:uncharacterized protein YegP (UPF0339 family)